ncbi:MAG: glycosyltransferase family 2 protein [Gemmataceae bacterium]
MDLSIVTTLYRSAAYLPEFHRRVAAAAERLGGTFEIVLVNDGSPDESQAVAEAIAAGDARVKVVELARNFGHHKAIMTGLAEARGRRVFLIDCDLEEAPEWLADFDRLMQEQRVDVVYGVQTRRKGDRWERWTGGLFYHLVRLLSDYPVPRDVVTARLMTRDYVRALIAHREREIFLGGLWAITGFRQAAVPVTKKSKGTTSYDLRRKLAIMVNAITSFSAVPLWVVFWLGCLILVLTTVATAGVVAHRLLGGTLSGWSSLIISVWLLGGLCLFALGINGIYLAKIFSEVKQRPYTLVRSVTPPAKPASLLQPISGDPTDDRRVA